MREVYIVAASRTPIGAFLGQLKDVPGPQLGATAIKESLARSGLAGAVSDGAAHIDECLMGSVLTAGVGQAPARQAAIFAGLKPEVRCTTVNRVCGSGLKSVMLGEQAIRCQDAEIIIAGGMESMSRAPYLLERAREGLRLGHGKVIDSLVHDGLWDVYHNYHMGDAAELCSREKHFDRKEQDRYALQSYQRAIDAVKRGLFKDEITPVSVTTGKETKSVDTDEEPFKAKLDKLGDLKPAFQKEGTVTAGNASPLSDGASALVLASEEAVRKYHLEPIARIVAHESHAQPPEWFTTAPIGAIEKLVTKAKISIDKVDLFEINEAFSVVALACVKGLKLSEDQVNMRGGAVALGHPIGASGARILTTLLYTLKAENKKLGVAALCIGGGEASAMLVERL